MQQFGKKKRGKRKNKEGKSFLLPIESLSLLVIHNSPARTGIYYKIPFFIYECEKLVVAAHVVVVGCCCCMLLLL